MTITHDTWCNCYSWDYCCAKNGQYFVLITPIHNNSLPANNNHKMNNKIRHHDDISALLLRFSKPTLDCWTSTWVAKNASWSPWSPTSGPPTLFNNSWDTSQANFEYKALSIYSISFRKIILTMHIIMSHGFAFSSSP